MYKPVILLGAGARSNPELVKFLGLLNIPIMTTWMAVDLLPEDSPVYCGRPGIFGQRASNIIQNKATHIYCFGARLDGEQTAHDFSRFAPNAKKIIFDVDQAELDKFPAEWEKHNQDLSIITRVGIRPVETPKWLWWCKDLYHRFRPELDADTNGKEGYIGTKEFITALGEACRPDDLLAIGSSSGAVNTFLQTFKVKKGQRVTVCASIGAMGADIPMAIGVALANPGARVICVTGDGGFQLNAQELAVVSRLKLNIKFFVFNNNGYGSIRAMQDVRFEGRHVGADPASGFTIAPIDGLAQCYGIEYDHLLPSSKLRDLPGAINSTGPMIIEVMADPDWRQYPKVGSTLNGTVYTVDKMEDMTPHLSADDLKVLMEWDG